MGAGTQQPALSLVGWLRERDKLRLKRRLANGIGDLFHLTRRIEKASLFFNLNLVRPLLPVARRNSLAAGCAGCVQVFPEQPVTAMNAQRTTRRHFLKTSLAAAVACRLPAWAAGAGGGSEVRLAVVGLGGIDVPGSVGGRGRQLINGFREVPSAKIVALCDVDQAVLDHGVKLFQDRGETVAAHKDFRRVLDDKNIDAVVLATPNHWHALQTIWACEAGKDVYVEKPFSHNIWEGRQMVAAARKHKRVVQMGTQRRASAVLPQAFEYLRSGQLGAIRCAHALVYRARTGIGKVSAPTPVPATVDYDLWCGPAPKTPLMRGQLHYDWHWVWPTGNGDMGNNGVHVIDICRWALGQNQPPPRAISIGGRFLYRDDAETPNAQIAFFDYQPVPILCEIRNVQADETKSLGAFHNTNRGIVIVCEGGHFDGDYTGGAVFDKQGRKLKEFKDGLNARQVQRLHLANFIEAVRSRKTGALYAEAEVGHVSTVCSHMANISHRIGAPSSPGAIKERIRSAPLLSDAFDRCCEYLRENGIDLGATPAVLGPWVTLDPKREQFVGEFADDANRHCRRKDRAPFVVPKIV
ncbi:MAG: Gfo/Idh/MocA family oxidoreductase [Verrucomicrobia bacterium]|nr:Gfo/Idh/MocA family oxidoreductase [Verrucomicrobiota bacterium]